MRSRVQPRCRVRWTWGWTFLCSVLQSDTKAMMDHWWCQQYWFNFYKPSEAAVFFPFCHISTLLYEEATTRSENINWPFSWYFIQIILPHSDLWVGPEWVLFFVYPTHPPIRLHTRPPRLKFYLGPKFSFQPHPKPSPNPNPTPNWPRPQPNRNPNPTTTQPIVELECGSANPACLEY